MFGVQEYKSIGHNRTNSCIALHFTVSHHWLHCHTTMLSVVCHGSPTRIQRKRWTRISLQSEFGIQKYMSVWPTYTNSCIALPLLCPATGWRRPKLMSVVCHGFPRQIQRMCCIIISLQHMFVV